MGRCPMKRRLLFALLAAAALTALFSLSWVDSVHLKSSQWLNLADYSVSDTLYQKAGQGSKDILVIGIDEASASVLSRRNMAKAITLLNADPNSQPAVIGIDILYSGESVDPEADRLLADAVAQTDNVVVASVALFGNDYALDDKGYFRVVERVVLGWEDPYPALSQVADVGIINCMEDPDGIIRHSLLYAEDASRGRVFR